MSIIKVLLTIKRKGDEDSLAWVETCLNFPKTVVDIDTAVEWGKEVLKSRNDTAPSYRKHILLDVSIEEHDGQRPHDWVKTSKKSIYDPIVGNYSTYRCRNCGITGKSYGSTTHVIIDKKYPIGHFKFCKENARR